jgi:Thioredoxin like C-terminal domain
VHAVLRPGGAEPIPFRVLIDGDPPGSSHGVHTDEEGNGELKDGRMYQLVRQQGPIGERNLTVEFSQPGAEAYSFTFG